MVNKNKKDRLSQQIVEDEWYLIDKSTGEIIDTVGEGDSVSIKRKEQIEFTSKYDTKFKKECAFVKSIIENVQLLYDKVTPSEYALAMKLMTYVGYDNNILMKGKKIMSTNDIAEECNLNYHNARKMIRALIDVGVLVEDRAFNINFGENKPVKCFIFNPFIAYKGTKISNTVINIFKDKGWN